MPKSASQILAMGFILVSTLSQAAPLAINEATFPGAGGDYNNLLSPPRAPGLAEIFRPGAGINTFAGSIRTGTVNDQGDTWAMLLDPGQFITRIRVSFGTNQDIAINQGSVFTLETSGPTPTAYTVNLPGTNSNMLPTLTDSGVLSIGTGFYTATILTGVLASSTNGAVGYVVSFDVIDTRAIPTPASLGMMLVGLIGLGAAARRRSSR